MRTEGNPMQKYLKQMSKISKELTTTTDKSKLYCKITQLTKEFFQFDYSTLMLLQKKEEKLVTIDTSGFPTEIIGSTALSAGIGLSTHVLHTKKPSIVLDFKTETRFEIPPIILEERITSALCVPMMLEEEVFGVLIGHTLDKRYFNKEVITFYQCIGNMAAVAIKNAIHLLSLKYSEHKFRTLIKTSNDCAWEVDKNAVYTYVSPKVHDILGREPDEMIGRKHFDFMHPDEALRVAEKLSRKVANCEPFELLEITMLHKQGYSVILESSGLPVFDEKGRLLGYQGIGRDITFCTTTENQLQLRSQELEEANIALKVLLKRSGEAKKKIEESVHENIRNLILPYINDLEIKLVKRETKLNLDIIKANLDQICTSFSQTVSSKYETFTPREIQVIDLISEGRSNKEIAELLRISKHSVEFHRANIRKKFGIKNQKINLRSYIQGLQA
jgi:PAS domain S-box-containing protein